MDSVKYLIGLKFDRATYLGFHQAGVSHRTIRRVTSGLLSNPKWPMP